VLDRIEHISGRTVHCDTKPPHPRPNHSVQPEFTPDDVPTYDAKNSLSKWYYIRRSPTGIHQLYVYYIMAKKNILVLGLTPSLVWNVSRSLKREGISPFVLAWQPLAPVQLFNNCIKYITLKNVKWIDNELDIGLLDQVEEVCVNERIDIVIPADYGTAILLSRCENKDGIPRCLISETDTIRLLNDKWELAQLLDKLALPYPASERIESPESLLATKLTFPIITKPLAKWDSVGFEIHHTIEDLRKKLHGKKLQSEFPLIAQEYIPGWDVGFSFIANKGKIIAYSIFEHKNRSQRTFIDDKRVLDIIRPAIQETQYSGVGHWDTRYNPNTDEYKILELNPRFWASLLYSTKAGLNYPYLLSHPEIHENTSFCISSYGTISLGLYERIMAYLTSIVSSLFYKTLSFWHTPK
jgi:predicted ATP-grasp superfamily ATP-dependent carboligase